MTIAGTSYIQVTTGLNTCGLTAIGTLKCWGGGITGNGTAFYSLPQTIP